MNLRLRSHSFPKLGCTPSEYEDAFFPNRSKLETAGSSFSLAIADGATESAFSREWAQLLVQEFGPRFPANAADFQLRLKALSQRWLTLTQPRCTTWFLEAKAAQGAHSTLLAFSLEESRPGQMTWKALAIGDSCLFHVQANRFRQGLPITTPEQFGNSPVLVPSSVSSQVHLSGRFSEWLFEGTAQTGDLFFFCTDALAKFFLEEVIRDPAFSRHLFSKAAVRGKQFPTWLWKRRSDGRIKNDDLTLVTLEVKR